MSGKVPKLKNIAYEIVKNCVLERRHLRIREHEAKFVSRSSESPKVHVKRKTAPSVIVIERKKFNLEHKMKPQKKYFNIEDEHDQNKNGPKIKSRRKECKSIKDEIKKRKLTSAIQKKEVHIQQVKPPNSKKRLRQEEPSSKEEPDETENTQKLKSRRKKRKESSSDEIKKKVTAALQVRSLRIEFEKLTIVN